MDKNTPAVTIQTLAFNVENYIVECAESVLNQSFANFEWVVLDNGSTDRTSEILEGYARKDGRIKLFKNERNSIVFNEPFNPEFVEYCSSLQSEYWCVLDSDDFLHRDFLKEMYTAAIEHDADIAVGGTEMFQEENIQMRGTRCPPDFYTDDITSLAKMLPQIYGCFRPIWGKLFKVSTINKRLEYRNKRPVNLVNGKDTVICFDFLRVSKSVVGLNKVLHYYRMRKNSLYNAQIDKTRYLDYKIIYDESRSLLKLWNQLTDQNLNFIANVLYASLKDCFEVAAKAKSISIQDRLGVIETILSDRAVYQVLEDNGLINNIFIDVQNSIDQIIDNMNEPEPACVANHYLCRLFRSINMAASPRANIPNAFLLYLSSICDQNNKHQFGAMLLPSFLSLTGKDFLVKDKDHPMKNEFLASDPELLRALINSDYAQATNICNRYVGNENYDQLKSLINKYSTKPMDLNPISKANDFVKSFISEENYEKAAELLLQILNVCPLDKEALCSKLYLLTLNGDLLTALETATVLRVFYADDSNALTLAAQACFNAGLKTEARKLYHQAAEACKDDSTRIMIQRELETIY